MPAHWIAFFILMLRMLMQSIQLRQAVRGTTLTTTANWGILVAVLWVATVGLSASIYSESPVMQDQLWYWTAVVSLVPPIAVLGAKRPGSEAWNFFVLIPLVFVLGWPALTVWSGQGPGALRVESPVLIGFVLVLIMGCGNYVATRIAFPALLYALSVILVLAPCSTVSAGTGVSTEMFRLLGALAMLQATLWGGWILRRAHDEPLPGPELVWYDFREMFGIVWTKRAMDRINEEFADREKWPARLGSFGLEWSTTPSAEQTSQVNARLLYALQWLLRRFVDPDWINDRLDLPDTSADTPTS